MPSIGLALLCQAALGNPDGTFSVLGAGITMVGAPEFPLAVSLSLAAQIEWEESELDVLHLVRVAVHHQDGEPLAQIDVPTTPSRVPGPATPVRSTMILPLPLLVRRTGTYQYDISVDAEVRQSVELVVIANFPAL